MSNVFARSAAAILMVLSFIALGGAAAAQTQRGDAADLTGAWTLNKDLSDDAAKVMEKMMSGDHGSGDGHTPPAGVGGGHGPEARRRQQQSWRHDARPNARDA